MWDLEFFLSAVRVSAPLLFAALGGMMSERAGVINIALEGKMLIGAFFAVVVTLATNNPYLGLMAAMSAGLVLALLYALFVIRLGANQIVAGTAMNMLAMGLAPFFGKLLYDTAGSTPAVALENRLDPVLLWVMPVLVMAAHFWMWRTPSGMWVRFAGEHPKALDAAGVRVNSVRWASVAMSGVLAGIGGATLSILLSSSFTKNMSAGRGFMALAALIFGRWKPIPTAFACFLFGVADAAQIRLQGVPVYGEFTLPTQFIQILPYLVTLLVLAGFVGGSRPPKGLGTPFSK